MAQAVIPGYLDASGLFVPFGSNSNPSIPVTPPSGTFTPFNVTASQTKTVPVGAFSGSVILLTGTGTFGGLTLQVGLPYSWDPKMASTVDLVLGSTSTASLAYFV